MSCNVYKIGLSHITFIFVVVWLFFVAIACNMEKYEELHQKRILFSYQFVTKNLIKEKNNKNVVKLFSVQSIILIIVFLYRSSVVSLPSRRKLLASACDILTTWSWKLIWWTRFCVQIHTICSKESGSYKDTSSFAQWLVLTHYFKIYI